MRNAALRRPELTTAACIAAGLILVPAAYATIAPLSASAGVCAEDIIAKMIQADDTRDRSLKEYSAVRHYTLRGEKSRTAQMTVRLDYHSGSGKSFQILAENGAQGVFRHVLDKVLQAEAEASRNSGHNDDSISPANYNFRLLGQETRDGRNCYVVQLLPRRKSKYLIEGRAWIDADDYALVRLEGRTAGSVSFWVGRPYIVQNFQKVGNYWLASNNDSIANAKFFGRTELTINSSNYSVPGVSGVQVAEKTRSQTAN